MNHHIAPGQIWVDKKDRIAYRIISSEQYGDTVFERMRPSTNPRFNKPRKKKTHYFMLEFISLT